MTSPLREWRERARLSQGELAERCGVSRQFVGAIEGGSKLPSRRFLAALRSVAGPRLVLELLGATLHRAG